MQEDTRITIQQERFVNEVLKGKKQTEAFIIAYPHSKKWKPASVTCEASKLMAQPKVRKRFEELQEEFREREKEKTGWTREQSIETLRFVIDTNKKDLERIQQASEQELEQIQKAIKENPADAEALIVMMLEKKRKIRANMTNNSALIAATAELNKMQGYNEQNINMNGTVVFTDEDKLED